MIPFTPDERRAEFAPSQNPGGPVDPDVLAVLGQPAQEPAAAQPTMNQQVDPDVLDIVNRDQIPLMSSLMSASRVNPDQAAEASRLGARIGVGQDVALRNLDEVRQRAFMADMQARDIARTNPVLASFLMDRNFSQQASDDVGVLDGLKNVFMDVGRVAAGMPATYIPGELVRGYMRGQRVVERGEIGMAALIGGIDDSQYDRARQLQEELQALGEPGMLGKTAEVVAQQVSSAREMAASTLVGTAAGSWLGPVGAGIGGSIGLGTSILATTERLEAGNWYLDMREEGIPDDIAVPAALAVGLINGLIEIAGAKIALAPFKGMLTKVLREQVAEAVKKPTMRAALAQAGKSYVLQVGTEAAEEGLQETVGITGEVLAKVSSGMVNETTVRQAVDQIIDATVQGAMGAAIIGGIGPGANLAIDLKRAQRAGRQTKFFESLTQNATESKVRGRDAGAYERFVAAQAAGTNAETVFVDGATMRGVLEQAAVTDSQLDAVVPGLSQKVRDAATTGSDVTIPTAQYAARLAGTDLGNALLPHMRLAPDAISATEAQAVESSRAEIVAQAERLMEEKQTVDAAFVQSAQAVEDSIFNAVKAVGYSDVQARTYAKIHQAMVVVDAAAMGITPEEYNRTYQPTIVGAGMPVQAMEQAAVPEPSARVVELLPTSRVLDERGFGPITHPVDGDEVAAGQAMRTVLGGIDVPRKYLKTPEAFDYLLGAINQVLLNKSKDSTDYDRTAASMGRALRTDLATVDDIVIAAKKLGYAGIDQDLRLETEAALTKTDVLEVLDQIPIAPEMFDQAARIDSDYMAAVERGDMATAQRMVDEAARASGYTIPVYHFTESEQPFTSFDIERGKSGPGIWLTSSPEGWYGRRMDLYLNPGKIENVKSQFDPTWREGELSIEGILEGDLETISQQNIDTLRNTEQYLSTFYVATRPEQVKSADAVTRDEAGNIVPLSRRFDITSPRIFEQAAIGVPTTIDAASNVESSFDFAGTQTFRNNRQFKKAIQDRVNTAAKEAGIDLTQFTPDVEQYLVRVAVADAITALRTNPNAVGWYNEKVTKALRLVSLIHPEIAIDPRAKFAFTWALAVTSNGLKVDKNFELAERAYAEYKQTGKMPTNVGAGTAQIAINESLGLFNELVDKYGIDEVEKFMTSKTTVKEVIAYTNKNVSGENLTTEVYGAAALGPKIGNGFFANLYGHFEQLTMDRWLMRTWGRWTGTLLEDNERNIVLKRKQLAGIIKAMPAKNRKQLEAIVGMSLATDDLDSLAAAINKASTKKENRLEMAKIGIADEKAQAKFTKIIGEPTRGVQRISYGDEFRKLGNALAKYLDGQKEAPSGPPERARIRKVFAQALAELQTQFPSLTMSDLQALLWYPEKRLYDAAKTADEGQTGYEDNAAPDYANSAAKLALAKGISQDVVNATIGEVDAELATIAAERTAGAERRIGNLVLRQDARLAGAGFEQAARGPARGGFDPRRLTTIINKGADVTTLFHELIHYKVEVYLRIASAPDAPARIKADLDELFKFMGVAGATFEERLATYNGLTFEQRRPLEEKITYNFEDYLLDGKAPSVEMRGVFDRIAAWMRRVYKSLRDDLNAIYRREFGTDLPILTPEIRAVFDRMLASEEQIKRAEAVNNMKGLFQTQAESGMDDATWAAYQAMQKEATDEAIAALTADTMKQVEWMSNARSKKLKELQKAHDTQRKEIRDQVMAEVRQEPIYRAMEYLKRGTLIGPDGSEATVEGVHKINTALAREFVPGLDMAKMGRGKYGYLAEDGLHPDIVAEMFGFPAGSALLQALADAKPMREVVDARTDEIMVRDYSEMGDPKAQEAAVNRAIHNEARARLVAVEARWLSKATQPVRVIQEAARQAAVDAVGNTVIRDLRPDQYAAAEARASRDAIEAARGADTKRLRDRYGADATREQIMLQAKRQQLYQNALATEAQKADDAIQKGLKYLRRVLRDSNRQRMGADYADQIAGILDRFELAPISRAEAARRADLAAWVEAKRAEGLEPDIDPEVLAESNRRPWRNLTVTEINAVMDAVKQIEFMSKNERKIKLAAEKADFEKVRDEIVTSVIANAGDRKANARTATTNIGRAITTLKGFVGAHLKAASIARILDGAQDGGPVWNYLIRSANDAGDKETTMRAQATERLTAIFAPIFKLGKMGGKGQYFPTVDRSFNREARLVIALNMGNDGNIQRLLDGEGWSIEQITPILQSLTEEEWNLVQQVWDYFETYRPEIAAKERELYGKEPNWVEPKPMIVQTADGKTVTLRGGYYPIKYDPRASMRSETMSDAEVAKRDLAGAFTSATTRRSYTKSRVKEVKGRPLLYTLAGMYGGVNEVIHDLSWHRWLIQANRLMRSQAFDEAVREKYGPEFIGQLKTWIKDVAAGERGVQNEAEMALNFLRQGISSAGLGFNVVSAALQITGFNQSIVRVGVKWIGRGIAAVAQSPLLSMKMVNEKSDFMANRSRTQFRELNELRNMVQGDSVAMRRIKMGTYFLMMRMQRMVDVPTWIGAYEKALYEGRDEDTSIALADQAVIDSQGGGMLKDLSRVERGGAGLKLFTVFYGYMNTVYNMAAVQTMTAKNKGKLAADYAMLFVVPVVLGQLIRKAMVPKTEDEPEDLEAIARKLAAEQLSYLMGTMVIVREFGEISKIVAGAEGPRMGYGGPAGLRAVGETYNFATQASQGEFDKAFRKSAVNLIGAFTGLPSAQINRTLDGLDALYEGETENVLAPATGVRR